jgi:hypothetical protein
MSATAFETVPSLHSATEFHQRLELWGFVHRRNEIQHEVLRGPNGGTIRVNRSQNGSADPSQVKKAAGLLTISEDEFWSGVHNPQVQPSVSIEPTPIRPSRDSAPEPIRYKRPDSDTFTATVLSIHCAEDRPLSFDTVVQIGRASGHSVSRIQVMSASANLCREGDLRRIRSGVYQWSGGALFKGRPPSSTVDLRITHEAGIGTARDPLPSIGEAPGPSGGAPDLEGGAGSAPVAALTSMEMFELLFPNGITMTADLFEDFENWKRLTEKFTALAG